MSGLFDAIDLNNLEQGDVASWHPCDAPEAISTDLQVATEICSVDLGNLNAECIQLPSELSNLKGQTPKVVSIPIGRGCRPQVRSFTFACPSEQPTNNPSTQAANPKPNQTLPVVPRTSTRIQPPRDVVKLKDRLDYILQPSLESLMLERSLQFPFEPFSYQFEGVAFFYPRHAAILADEMGLGKTMQAITAIRLLLRRGELKRVLLVCPKPLVTNWQRKFATWAPEVPVTVIEGNQQQRQWRWQLPHAPVKIANYELLNRDIEFFADGPIIDGLETPNDDKPVFDLVVLDEAQRIKNRRSATSQAARSIKSRRRWALTGTPVENSTEDLVGIFEFLSPGFLSPDLRPRKMGRTVRDYVLRRTKNQVLIDLPPKMFRDAELDLSPEQQMAYQLAEEQGVVQLNSLGDQLSIQHVFELVLRLKQICNFDPATGVSSKFERLEADLEEVAQSGRKALVFSQWVGTLKTLSKKLSRFGVVEYHGGIPSRKRDSAIKQFRADPDSHVMLLSYGAGSVGLNLQFAGYVFLYDRWWNPAVEDQAINRVHRIGSTGPVTVSRFMTLDTIEERINCVLEEKRELFDTIFSDTQHQKKMGLTQDEVFGLFDLKSPKGTIKTAA